MNNNLFKAIIATCCIAFVVACFMFIEAYKESSQNQRFMISNGEMIDTRTGQMYLFGRSGKLEFSKAGKPIVLD